MNHYVSALIGVLVAMVAVDCCAPAQDRNADEDAAIRAAVARVAPSVVQIETIGGAERVEKLLFGTGPSTGVVVDARGYIVSSAFNFGNRPASILVRLSDGTRKPAKLVATDHSRMLVLLKVQADKPLPVAPIAPQAEMRVGQWTIAVGRAFDAGQPNIAVGILSAVGRVWKKAIQTSAAVSPNNYGGPLIDIRGRVMGVLVPLSPESASELAGVDWYDSGIGFAIPADHVMNILPRLERGEDLRAGLMGIGFRSRGLYSDTPVLARCHPRSPADKAGLRPGDQIVEIDGAKIEHPAQVKEAIVRRYAGDKLQVAVLREGKRLEFEVKLTDKLLAFEQPTLGILPLRRGALESEAGLVVRWVFPGGPADKAGVRAGDRLVTLGGKPIGDRDELVDQLGNLELDSQVELALRRGEQNVKVKVRLGRPSAELPPKELPPARIPQKTSKKRIATGMAKIAVSAAGAAREVWTYVPGGYEPSIPHGLLVWLEGTRPLEAKEFFGPWAESCRKHELIVVIAKPPRDGGWRSSDTAAIGKLLEELQATYTIDPARVVVGGQETGGAAALQAAFRHRALVRGVIAADSPVTGQLPENEPGQALSFLLVKAGNRLLAAMIGQGAELLRGAKFPVAVKDSGSAELNDSETVGTMVRWTDMLDRI